MNFITDNYIWFIIIGFVLLMITIGYYADKTKFGRKKLDDVSESDDDFDGNDIEIISENIPFASSTAEPVIQSGIRETEVLEPFIDTTNLENLDNNIDVSINVNNDNNFVQTDEMDSAVPEINYIPSQDNLFDDSFEHSKPLGTFETEENKVLDNVNLSDDDVWKF